MRLRPGRGRGGAGGAADGLGQEREGRHPLRRGDQGAVPDHPIHGRGRRVHQGQERAHHRVPAGGHHPGKHNHEHRHRQHYHHHHHHHHHHHDNNQQEEVFIKGKNVERLWGVAEMHDPVYLIDRQDWLLACEGPTGGLRTAEDGRDALALSPSRPSSAMSAGFEPSPCLRESRSAAA
eukprot:772186-Prorocentrum_minimum.AAC.1